MSNEPTIDQMTKKQCEERERDERLLSAFYYHMQYMRENGNNWSKGECISKFFENQEFERQAYNSLIDHENECYRHNSRLLHTIKKVKGNTFYKYLQEIIKSCDCVKEKMEIVGEPGGKWEDEQYGRTIKGVWIDQWTTGTEGDSFDGYLWVQLKEKKYLKISYSM
jgi:hypothetical protein